MKIYIGPYLGRLNVSNLDRWWYRTRYGKECWQLELEDNWKQDKWDLRFEKFTDILQNVYNATVNKLLDARERKIKVRIDPYDTWSMDNTLSHIIVPMLKQLKATKHGSPFVDDEDVPEHLRSSAATPLTQEEKDRGHVDDLHEARWDWVLDEMIFAWECIKDDSWEDQFYTGVHDIIWKPVDKEGNEVSKEEAKLFEMTRGPNDTSHYDAEGHKAFSARITRGTTLFGRYARALWD